MPILRDLSHRELVGELMDDPTLDPKEHHRALAGLRRINALSGVVKSLWRELAGTGLMGKGPVKLLDIASGGGDIAIGLKRRAVQGKMELEVHGCDISPTAINIASQASQAQGAHVQFHQLDVIESAIPTGFDILTCGLFLHHLSDDQVIRLLLRMRESGCRVILISDLNRTLAGYFGAWWGTRILSRSRIVHIDGPLSVRAAFTMQEMLAMADQAGLTGATIRPAFPARWLLRWERA